MKWYSARLIFQIRTGSDLEAKQFDESLRLFQAESKEQAFAKARKAGVEDESSFHNIHGDLILWKFIDVNVVEEIGDLIDGKEFYSNTLVEDQPLNFIQSVKRHARFITNLKSEELVIDIE